MSDSLLWQRMLLKIIIFFIVTIILLCQINQVNSNTNSLNIINENNINIEDDVDVDIEEIEKTIETSNNPEELDLNSRIALIYDRASGNILFVKPVFTPYTPETLPNN